MAKGGTSVVIGSLATVVTGSEISTMDLSVPREDEWQSEYFSEEEISGLKEMFQTIDIENSGQISFEELKFDNEGPLSFMDGFSTVLDTKISNISNSDNLLPEGAASVFPCTAQTPLTDETNREAKILRYKEKRKARKFQKKISSGDGQGGSSFATGQSNDELSTNYGGLDLEALSRLDRRRWSSSCRSQEGLELVAVNRDGEEESMTESIRTLSQKYRPMFFEELIGQNIVVQSLMNAILRGRVASLYLFQGPRGTGKTSTARVLAAALNCLASNKTKPCGTKSYFSSSVTLAESYVTGGVKGAEEEKKNEGVLATTKREESGEN
ncbi:hypothetical protein RJ639_042135 [Escallonia herrerae]|uniref:EF-hand domain-containing protein n=1 Tax=Escallonia herrerae TaxID=1293975 RepID=A0AA88WJ89_9ASTE|nr:hypothetical protein RJ639_042135 [Escallonia herrerae]